MNTFGCYKKKQLDSEVCKECNKKIDDQINELDHGKIKIVDPIYGLVEIDDYIKIIIDTCYLQRLRRIKQLGFSYLTFPNATHTRFEHSLGVYYLIYRICENENHAIDNKFKFILKTAAILHDIGHGPFSHFSEELSDLVLGREHSHEKRAGNMISPEWSCLNKTLKKIMSKLGFSDKDQADILKKIPNYISGYSKDSLSLLINGPIDVDKMDYIVRDSYHTGVPFGLGVDLFFICDNIRFDKVKKNGHKQIIFNEKAEAAILNLLYAYATSYQAIHYHHVNIIASEMILKIFNDVDISKISDNDKTSLFWTDDCNFLNRLGMILSKKAQKKQYHEIYKMFLRINNRCLPKRKKQGITDVGKKLDFNERRAEEKKSEIITCSSLTKKVKNVDRIRVVKRDGSLRELLGYVKGIKDRFRKIVWECSF
ncbi:MAG: HD domain-containing protein [Candidatus Margulisiibacteriota bacterium]|nr:HD domain-containing protein [Candidatus Margulisiibacteriota bacterium]